MVLAGKVKMSSWSPRAGDLVWYKDGRSPWWPGRVDSINAAEGVYKLDSFGTIHLYDVLMETPMQPYRCADFEKLWHALEVSKSLKKGGAKELRAEADAAERKQTGGAAGTATATARAPTKATTTAAAGAAAAAATSKPSGPAKASSAASKAAPAASKAAPAASKAAPAASKAPAAPSKASSAPSKALPLPSSVASKAASGSSKAAPAPVPAEARAAKRERDNAPAFKVHNMVWYKGKAADPYWPAQILRVDTTTQTYNLDPFGDSDHWDVKFDAPMLPYRTAQFDELWAALEKSKMVHSGMVPRIRQAADQAESLLPETATARGVPATPVAVRAPGRADGYNFSDDDDNDDDGLDDDLPSVQVAFSRSPTVSVPTTNATSAATTPLTNLATSPTSLASSTDPRGPPSTVKRRRTTSEETRITKTVVTTTVTITSEEMSSQDSVATAFTSPAKLNDDALWAEILAPVTDLGGGPSQTPAPASRVHDLLAESESPLVAMHEPAGTIVLAYYRPSKRYFPAVIESFDAAKGRYSVRYDDDGKVRQLERKEFYTHTDPGFADCQIDEALSQDTSTDGIDRSVKDLKQWLMPAVPELRAIVAGERPSWRHAAYVKGDRHARSQLSNRVGRGRLSTATWHRITEILTHLQLSPHTDYVMQVLLPDATILVHRALDPDLSYEDADRLLTKSGNSNIHILRALQNTRRGR